MFSDNSCSVDSPSPLLRFQNAEDREMHWRLFGSASCDWVFVKAEVSTFLWFTPLDAFLLAVVEHGVQWPGNSYQKSKGFLTVKSVPLTTSTLFPPRFTLLLSFTGRFLLVTSGFRFWEKKRWKWDSKIVSLLGDLDSFIACLLITSFLTFAQWDFFWTHLSFTDLFNPNKNRNRKSSGANKQ